MRNSSSGREEGGKAGAYGTQAGKGGKSGASEDGKNGTAKDGKSGSAQTNIQKKNGRSTGRVYRTSYEQSVGGESGKIGDGEGGKEARCNGGKDSGGERGNGGDDGNRRGVVSATSLCRKRKCMLVQFLSRHLTAE